jgi:hypothetical protein
MSDVYQGFPEVCKCWSRPWFLCAVYLLHSPYHSWLKKIINLFLILILWTSIVISNVVFQHHIVYKTMLYYVSVYTIRGMDIPYFFVPYYMFRPNGAILRYIRIHSHPRSLSYRHQHLKARIGHVNKTIPHAPAHQTKTTRVQEKTYRRNTHVGIRQNWKLAKKKMSSPKQIILILLHF